MRLLKDTDKMIVKYAFSLIMFNKIEKNGGRLFRWPKLTLSCMARGEGRKEGRKEEMSNGKQLNFNIRKLG
jgi:hypothetical protein